MVVSCSEIGPLNHAGHTFGSSLKGVPLEVFLPVEQSPKILLMASIHGDESISTVLLSECLRSMEPSVLKSAVILSANPDGTLVGTRCNAGGVDLNRNFPSQNWVADPVFYRNRKGGPQDIPLSPGSSAGSEPETQAIMGLIDKISPKLIVSLHGFLNCIDDPQSSTIAMDLARRTNMEVVPDVGYETPGSFGSWCAEKQIPIITYELPFLPMDELRKIHNPVLSDLMTGHYEALLG